MRLILTSVVLCQLVAASVCFASANGDGTVRTASLDRSDGAHSVTVGRTDSGSALTIDHTDSAVSVTIDGSEQGRVASGEAADAKSSEILYFNNSSLPGGGVPADTRLSGNESKDPRHIFSIEGLLDRAIAQSLIEGGVAVVGNRSGILSSTARGRLTSAAGAPALNEHTVFDLASLTKVIATAPAVMKLVDQGRVNLSDPLSKWFPEFTDTGHEPLTVLSLLTHTSGLDDVGVSSDQPMESTVRKAAAQRHARPGSRFHYADLNFILLGELVHRVSGEPLNVFCQEQIYGPLGTTTTMFLPPRSLAASIAPTSGGGCGIVQDPNARRLGGVAGHAGLFSSAYDLSRFARMVLGGGMLDDRRILSEQIVAQMSAPYVANNGAVIRGLGWDINSPYSAPKGSFFSASSFGHTGYSGSSIWIDPKEDMFVILLTNRVNYRDTHAFNQLRRDVSTIAAASYKMPGNSPATLLAGINVEVLQEVSRAMQNSPRVLKLASLSGGKVKHLRGSRKVCKVGRAVARTGGRRAIRSAQAHRGTRSAKAHAAKAVASAKKKRGQGRRT